MTFVSGMSRFFFVVVVATSSILTSASPPASSAAKAAPSPSPHPNIIANAATEPAPKTTLREAKNGDDDALVLGRSSSSSFSLVAEEQTVADDDVVAFDRGFCNLLLSLGREDDDERREENALVDVNALISSPRIERLCVFVFLVRVSRLCARNESCEESWKRRRSIFFFSQKVMWRFFR